MLSIRLPFQCAGPRIQANVVRCRNSVGSPPNPRGSRRRSCRNRPAIRLRYRQCLCSRCRCAFERCVACDRLARPGFHRRRTRRAAGCRHGRGAIQCMNLGPAALTAQSRLLDAMAERGWVAQVQLPAAKLNDLAPLLERVRAPLLFDHLGLLDIGAGVSDAGFQRLLGFGQAGAFIKLFGAFRVSGRPFPHPDLDPFVVTLLRAFPKRSACGVPIGHSPDWQRSHTIQTRCRRSNAGYRTETSDRLPAPTYPHACSGSRFLQIAKAA